jgi:hypothetical protein
LVKLCSEYRGGEFPRFDLSDQCSELEILADKQPENRGSYPRKIAFLVTIENAVTLQEGYDVKTRNILL